MTDNQGATASTSLTIHVTGTNDAPVATMTTGTVVEDGAPQVAAGNLLANASDVDHNSVLSVASVNGLALVGGAEGSAHIDTSYGSLTVHADGSYSYALANGGTAVQSLGEGESHDEVFNYTVTDEHGATSQTTLTIHVNGTNDARSPRAIGPCRCRTTAVRWRCISPRRPTPTHTTP